MRRRRPLLRARHVVIRFRARRRARLGIPIPVEPLAGPGSLLNGQVDEPSQGDRVDTYGFSVRGWCTWGPRPALAVAVCVDDVALGRALVSMPRPDVAAAHDNDALCDSGWQVHVGLGALRREGEVELSVLAWGEPTAPPVELGRFSVIVGWERATSPTGGEDSGSEYIGELHSPRQGERVGTILPVRGWAMRGPETLSRLDVLLNGEYVGRARLGLPRSNIGGDTTGPDAGISGFEYWVDLSSVSSSMQTARLQLVAGSSGDAGVTLFERVLQLDRSAHRVREQTERETVRAGRAGLPPANVALQVPDLNLAVFTHSLDYGGGQLWLDEFLRKVGAGTRFACTILSVKDGPLREIAERRGISVQVAEAPPVDDLKRYEDGITELAALVAAGDNNVVLVNTAPMFAGAVVGQRLSLPIVWAIHESFSPTVILDIAFGSAVHPLLYDALRGAMAAADALVFEAEATRVLFAPWGSPGCSVVVPYGVDTGEILAYEGAVSRSEARTTLGIRPESRLILVMGTIEQRKAQTRIAQAFGRVAHEHPEWDLVFVGDMGSPYSHALKTYVDSLELGDRCTVLPVDSDPYRWYRSADVLLSASDVESLPRSMLEAMCFGVTVVSASVFGVPELVKDGVNGFLFEPNDLDALEEALDRVLAFEPSELELVGEAARRHVLEHNDSSGYAGDILRLCQGLLQFPGATPQEILSGRGDRVDALDLDVAR